MNRYHVYCPVARLPMAQGVFYPIGATVSAESAEAAIDQFGRHYQTQAPPIAWGVDQPATTQAEIEAIVDANLSRYPHVASASRYAVVMAMVEHVAHRRKGGVPGAFRFTEFP